jgi:arylsulfatase A-like enzyme
LPERYFTSRRDFTPRRSIASWIRDACIPAPLAASLPASASTDSGRGARGRSEKGGAAEGAAVSLSPGMAPNLLLVIVDDLRADRLGCTGLARAETPYLDGLAKRGALYTRCFSASGWTLPACASIVTGRVPSDHGLKHHDCRFGKPKIPALLPGYATFGVGNNGNFVPDDIPQATLDALKFERRPEMWKRFGWQEGFERYEWFHKEDHDGPFGAFAVFLQGRQKDPRPWFAMLHTNIVHDYDMAEPWALNCSRFLGRELSPALRKFRDGPWVWKDVPAGMTDAQVTEEAIAKYDACIAETDRRLKEALASVDFANTVVVIVSDHGEGFDGTRDRVHHCGRLHDDLLRVPLIVVGAGIAPAVIDTPCSTIDVASTLVRLGGGDASALPGADLLDLGRGGPPCPPNLDHGNRAGADTGVRPYREGVTTPRTLHAEDFGYLYLPPNDVAERLRRFEYKTHAIEVRAEIEWPQKRIAVRIDRQSWNEQYDLELDPEERINFAVGAQGPTRRPEKDEGAIKAKLREWTGRPGGPQSFQTPKAWNSFASQVGRARPLPRSGSLHSSIVIAASADGGPWEAPESCVPMSFIVAVDDPVELQRHVMASRCFQSDRHQWLLVENRNNRSYSSISKLYSDVASRARFELRCYLHQDVLLLPDWESRLFDVLVKVEHIDSNWGVLGVAGRAPRSPGLADPPNVGHWSDPHKYHEPTVPLPAEVQILDELLMIVRADSGVTFDPDLPGFHCYGADLCLSARDKGMKSYVVDAPVVHKLFRPDGSLIETGDRTHKIASRQTEEFRADFMRSADYVRRKWAKYLPFEGTSYRWETA